MLEHFTQLVNLENFGIYKYTKGNHERIACRRVTQEVRCGKITLVVGGESLMA